MITSRSQVAYVSLVLYRWQPNTLLSMQGNTLDINSIYVSIAVLSTPTKALIGMKSMSIAVIEQNSFHYKNKHHYSPIYVST